MGWVAMVLVAVVALGAAVVAVASRPLARQLAFLRDLGTSGLGATVADVTGTALPSKVERVVAAIAGEDVGAGFAPLATTRTTVPGREPELMVHLADAGRRTVVRVGLIEGLGVEPSISAVSWFPGGRFVTSRLVVASAYPGEVVQCAPDAAPAELLAHHRDALAALATAGATPTAPPADLGRALQDEWRTESGIMVNGSLRERLPLAAQLQSGPRLDLLAGSPHVAAVAAHLSRAPD